MKDLDKNRIGEYFTSPTQQDCTFVEDAFFLRKNEEELKEIANTQWENIQAGQVDLQHVLNKIHFDINNKKAEKSLGNKFLHIYYRVAAILILPLIIAGALFWNNPNPSTTTYSELTAPKGSRVQFILPDGSTGHLNSGSTIRYASDFNTNRGVELSGEGYFNVKKNQRSPFVIETKHANIKVHGTSFDVCAYDADDKITTTLESGSVEIINKKTAASTFLEPGQQNQFDKNSGKMGNFEVDTKLYTSWKDDLLRFNNAPFGEVVKKMERWYGVKIILDESLQDSENYTMAIKTESLRETLQLLQFTTPMAYTIENDMVYIKKRNLK
jgi:ferric-dicitrate binding protein FerR (iron transport regulator)